MLISVGCSSLGLSKEEFGEKLESVVSDGVYQNKEDRTHGGGSLSLVNQLTKELGLYKEVISSHWDIPHMIERAVGDTLEKDKNFEATCEYLR